MRSTAAGGAGAALLKVCRSGECYFGGDMLFLRIGFCGEMDLLWGGILRGDL